jgi:prepilin-type N-terminal cleavage/methylation domain-containing protein
MSARQRRAQAGMTLLELMITMAVIAFLMIVGYGGVRKVRDSELAENAVEVVSLLRNAYLVSTETGKQARVVFDFDEQGFYLEVCPESRGMSRTAIEGEILAPVVPGQEGEGAPPGLPPGMTAQQLSLDPTIPPELLRADSPEDAMKIAAALSGKSVGTLRCDIYGGSVANADAKGAARRMRTEETIELRQIYVQHLEEPVTGGKVAVNFFPLGYAEKAIIEIGTKDGKYWTIISRGLGGRIELREGRVDNVDDILLRDASGERDDREAER